MAERAKHRLSERVGADDVVRIWLERKTKSDVRTVTLRDQSENGIGFISHEAIEPGEVIVVNFGPVVESGVRYRVIWCKDAGADGSAGTFLAGAERIS
jgi:hypothetical protein